MNARMILTVFLDRFDHQDKQKNFITVYFLEYSSYKLVEAPKTNTTKMINFRRTEKEINSKVAGNFFTTCAFRAGV